MASTISSLCCLLLPFVVGVFGVSTSFGLLASTQEDCILELVVVVWPLFDVRFGFGFGFGFAFGVGCRCDFISDLDLDLDLHPGLCIWRAAARMVGWVLIKVAPRLLVCMTTCMYVPPKYLHKY